MKSRLFAIGAAFLALTGGSAALASQTVLWTAQHTTPKHTFDLTASVDGSITTVAIKYDSNPLVSLNFTTVDGKLVHQPADPPPNNPIYTASSGQVTYSTYWSLDPEITPLAFGVTHDKSLLPGTATIYGTGSVRVGVLMATVPPEPDGGWGGTNPQTGNGNPGYPGRHPDNPHAPNGGPGGPGTGNNGTGGRGGDGVGNGGGGAGGNGAGNGKGGDGGNGSGTGNGGNAGNGGEHGNGGNGGRGGDGGGNGGAGGNGSVAGDGGNGGAGAAPNGKGGSGGHGGNGTGSTGLGGAGGNGGPGTGTGNGGLPHNLWTLRKGWTIHPGGIHESGNDASQVHPGIQNRGRAA